MAMVLTLVVFVGCGDEPRDGPPNVLVICVDTLRADHVGAFGGDVGLTPAIDRIAAGGARFQDAFAAAPFTAPAVTTMLTGASPLAHGVRSWSAFGRRWEGPTLGDAFRAHGYRTGFVGANGFLRPIRPIRDGFDDFEDLHDRPAPALARSAVEWIEARGDDPWFLWVHFYDPHAPYVDHAAEQGDRFLTDADRAELARLSARPNRDEIAPGHPDWAETARLHASLYAGEVAYADAAIATLVAAVGDDTIVVVVADHGENLADHAPWFSHNDALFDSLVRVPFAIAGPGVAAADHRGPVSLADLPRTLLDLSGIESGAFDGRSLATAARGDAPLVPAELVGLDAGRQRVFAVGVRTAGAKLIRFDEEPPRFVRYDLRADPGETTPISTGEDDPLAKRLEGWLAVQRALFDRRNGPDDGVDDVRTPEEIRQLRAFGYLR